MMKFKTELPRQTMVSTIMSTDAIFLNKIQPAIVTMQNHGMSSLDMAIIINEIRSAAINMEFHRLQRLLELHPPHHYTYIEMEDLIDDK